jgi:hypothetical protein
MTKLGIASAVLALATVFSTAAMAAPVDLTACTKDGKSVTLKIDVAGGIKDGPTLAALSQQAFGEAAREQTFEELLDNVDVFMRHLQVDLLTAAGDKGKAALTDDTAFTVLPNAAPVIGGACMAPAPAAK